MILDHLNNYQRYLPLHPGFEAGFDFLYHHPLADLKEGRMEIDGDRLFAPGMAIVGKGRRKAAFETHSKYIDIQYTVSGCDFIGWAEKSSCTADQNGYNSEKDIEFCTDRPRWWVPAAKGNFAIFSPEDAHAPLGAGEFVHKVVVKVAADWS